MVNPTRFLDKLIDHMETYVKLEQRGKLGYKVPQYHEFLKRLRAPECMRILFDARQAALFDAIDESPEPNMQRLIKPPFDMFYLEFTEPIILQTQEPGHVDVARAILYVGKRKDFIFRVGTEDIELEQAVLFLTTEWDPVRIKVDKDKWRKNPNAEVSEQEFREFQQYIAPAPPGHEDKIQYIDRAWTLRLREGLALSRIIDAKTNGSEVPEDWEDTSYLVATSQIPEFKEDRKVGWWEEAIHSYTTLLSWICAYTMAKSIHIIPQYMSRPQRRWHERKNIPLPKPWHVVKVEPKFSMGTSTAQMEGGQHRYRYDVIGHLRYGRHKKGDGSYSETIEWVPPHQRGLANDLYIPKTYKVEKGKIIAPAMRRYYGKIPKGSQ